MIQDIKLKMAYEGLGGFLVSQHCALYNDVPTFPPSIFT